MVDEVKSKTNTIKLAGTAATVVFAIIGGVFGAIDWIDGAYASTDELTAKLAPVNTEIAIIKVAQADFSQEVKELRKDRLLDQMREIKKEKYTIQRIIDSGTGSANDAIRLNDLELEIEQAKSRLDSIK